MGGNEVSFCMDASFTPRRPHLGAVTGFKGFDLTDVKQVPERIAILLVIQKQLNRLLSVINGRFQSTDRGSVGVRSLEKPAVSGDNLGTRVAGNFYEAV